MADISTCPDLTRASVQAAHHKIKNYVHRTPITTCKTLDNIASTPQVERDEGVVPKNDGKEGSAGVANPKIKLFLKCENLQRVGAFKARGAFHALVRLIDEQGLDEIRRKGVVTHSSGLCCLLESSFRDFSDRSS